MGHLWTAFQQQHHRHEDRPSHHEEAVHVGHQHQSPQSGRDVRHLWCSLRRGQCHGEEH